MKTLFYRMVKYLNHSAFLLLLTGYVAHAIPNNDDMNTSVQLNQVGFYPDQNKIAVVTDAETDRFYVVSVNTNDTLVTGMLSGPVASPFSDKTTYIADFSLLKREGAYKVIVPGVDASPTFEINTKVYRPMADAVLKAYYYQRASTQLESAFAGKWTRPAGHPDNEVYVHASAATTHRPEGTVISSPRGWYDAGDYNKYIVNSGISMYTLMALYEAHPGFLSDCKINIPESNNSIPDLLDEVLWNLRWMLTMQDPNDGGVYHKLTTANFEGMVMPENATEKRYVVKKSTSAALNFAAVMAQAHRVYNDYSTALPALADSCLAAAESAWKWASNNPEEVYNQNAMNENHDPDINTGAYGDRNVQDEFIWAALELYITTGDEKYLSAVDPASADSLSIPSWNNVKLLGYYSLLRHEKTVSGAALPLLKEVKAGIKELAGDLVQDIDKNPYHTVMGQSADDFIWGSNSYAANQAITLLYAYDTFADKRYLEGALSNFDYLLGRNATGYSFVTGYGDKTPMHPHHRPSEADGIEDPVPGLLVGGPNAGQQDNCDYPSDIPNESYTDHVCSYASNEITINWNAPMVYLAYTIEMLYNKQNADQQIAD